MSLGLIDALSMTEMIANINILLDIGALNDQILCMQK
jgi:hypothetical protein